MSDPESARPAPLTVLVTGGSGRLGRYVVDALSAEHRVVNADLTATDGPDRVNLDVTDLEAVGRALADGVDTVVHLAALDYDTNAEPERFITVNTLGTWNVLQSAAAAGIRRLVACSSIAALGLHEMRPEWTPRRLPVEENHEAQPAEAYSVSKLIIEEMSKSFVRLHGIDVMCLRPVAIVFPEEMSRFMRTVEPGRRTLYDYVLVEDVAQAAVAAVDRPWSGYQQVILTADDAAHRQPTLDWYEHAVGPIPPVDAERFAANPRASIFSNASAREVLGWRPRSNFLDVADRHRARESSTR